MSSTLHLETLVVSIKAQAGDYQQQIRKVIEDTKTATQSIAKTINSVSAAQKQQAREAAKLVAQAERETKRAADIAVRIAQHRDATIAQHHLRSHLRSIDQAASAERRAAAQSIRDAQRRDAAIARNYVQEHRRAIAQAAREQRAAQAALAARNAAVGSRISGTAGGMLTSARRMLPGDNFLFRNVRRAALGAGGIVGGSLAAFAGFEDAITRSAAVAGNVSNRMRAKLEANAKAIGASGIIGATEVAKGYTHLIQSGLSVEASLAAINTVQRFATASAMDLAKATELLSQSQSVLGLRTEDAVRNAQNMTQVSDVITKASILSTASIEDFAKALVTKSGAAMRILGKDITEGTAALAAMANQGTKGELAGERLYIMLRDSQQAAIKNAVAWKTLGVSVFDATGKMRHIADIIAGLENLMGGMSDEQRKITMKMLGFTDRSVAATYSMLGLSSAIREYERQLKGASGETDRIARTIEGSFLSSLKNLWNNLVVLGIEIGHRLSPFVRLASRYVVELSQTFSRLLRNVSDATAFRVFTAEMQKAMQVGGEIMGAFTGWLQTTFVPQLVNIGGEAGAAFATSFWEGFSSGAVDWQSRLEDLTKRRQHFSTMERNRKPGQVSNEKTIINLDQQIETARQRLASKTPQGPNLLESIKAIIEKNYGTPKPLGLGLPPATSAAPAAASRPDVVGSAATRSPSEVSDMLHSLSDEGKAEAKAAGKATDKAAAAAKRAQNALILESKRIHESVREPLERVNDELSKAKALLDKGLLSAQDFNRLRDKLYASLEKAGRAGTGRSGGSGDGFSGGFGFRAANGDDIQQQLVHEHLGRQQAHLLSMSAARRAGGGSSKPEGPRMTPQELAADQQAKLFGYSGLAGIAASRAAHAEQGRVVMAPVGNPLAHRIPKPASGALAAMHEHERFAEIARRDESELRANFPRVQARAELSQAGGASDKLQQSIDRLTEVMEENVEVAKENEKLELVAAGF